MLHFVLQVRFPLSFVHLCGIKSEIVTTEQVLLLLWTVHSVLSRNYKVSVQKLLVKERQARKREM